MSEEQGILDDTFRARMTALEYDGLDEHIVEELYIKEYGELPPDFEIYTSEGFNIGGDSGFHATAIHFHDENISEVYIINRGSEFDFPEFGKNFMEKYKEYKENPEKIKEIMFEGNENLYTDIFSIGLGLDQSSHQDNKAFIDQLTLKVKETNNIKESSFYKDAHSLGSAEAQMSLVFSGNLFTDVKSYNGAPMNAHNTIFMEDDLRNEAEEKFNISIRNSKDLHQVPTDELRAFLNEELGELSDKITFHQNKKDILTSTTLPLQFQLTKEDESNVIEYDDGTGIEMIDVTEEYPYITNPAFNLLHEAHENGVTNFDIVNHLTPASSKSLFEWPKLYNDYHLYKDIIEPGHSMDALIELIAFEEGRKMKDNEEYYFVQPKNGGEKIEVNIDHTYRYYKRGYTIIEGKRDVIKKLIHTYEESVSNEFESFRRKLQTSMDDIEASPQVYLTQHQPYVSDPQHFIRYRNLRFVNELPTKIPEQLTNQIEDMISDYEEMVKKQADSLEEFKDSIIQLVEEDERVSLLFNTYTERRL